MPNILQIVQHPATVLNQVCTPVTVFDEKLRSLAADMLYTIGRNPENFHAIGVGLAAPQVDQPIQLVVIAAPGYPEFAMVNPVIERAKGWKVENEGCLSRPFDHGDVYRFTDIRVTYQNLEGKPKAIKAKAFLARVIQHEVDHLEGIEFTDRIEIQAHNQQSAPPFALYSVGNVCCAASQ